MDRASLVVLLVAVDVRTVAGADLTDALMECAQSNAQQAEAGLTVRFQPKDVDPVTTTKPIDFFPA